ncbi:MAG: helix-turn-helix domain-containing protein [Promethearchaeota archaeon]
MESISDQLKLMVDDRSIYRSGNLFKCVLGLNDLESKVFSYLLKHEKVGTLELTKTLEKDRSLIQRALQKLIELKIVKRESMSLKEFTEFKGESESNKRGYLYVYSSKDLQVVKREISKLLDQWYSNMKNYIDNLDNLFDCFEIEGKLC